MVFTLLHPLISFLFYYPFRRRFEIFAFLLAAMLPDIESVYYGFEALSVCARQDFVCLAEYPSHYLLHSLLGILLLGIIAVFVVKQFRKYFHLPRLQTKILYVSAFLGGLSHLLVDSTVHRGADTLALFYPLDWRFSFVFSSSYLLWNFFALAGFVMFLYLWKKNKLKEILK